MSLPTRGRSSIVILMVALSMMSYVNRTAMSIVGPEVMKRFGLTTTELGSIYSAFILAYALFMVPGGWIADRYRPYRVVTIMCFVTALLTGLTALAGYPAFHAALGALLTFQVIRFLLGLVTAPLFPACGRLTAIWFDSSSRARVQAIVIGGAPLGAAITPVLLAPIVAGYGWQTALYLCAGATVLPFPARRNPSPVRVTAGMSASSVLRPTSRASMPGPAASMASSVSASVRRKRPAAVRRSASRWAPHPSRCPMSCASERT